MTVFCDSSESIRNPILLFHHDTGKKIFRKAALPGQTELFRKIIINMGNGVNNHFFLPLFYHIGRGGQTHLRIRIIWYYSTIFPE